MALLRGELGGVGTAPYVLREGRALTAITGKPAYRQVADDLRAKIRAGLYAVGDALPATTKLMETYAVSITVVRAAVRELQGEGVLIGQPGKGVYVAEVPTLPAGEDVDVRIAELVDAVRTLTERVSKLEAKGRRRA
jgi:GntR family transcriptional regulator